MADFYEIARERIKDLSSKKASERREAAYYLGEAGVDESITKLRTVYQSDPDPSVRKAAEYSLGMFRAIQEALEHGEQDKVVALLKKVVDEGKFGSRKKTPTGVLVVFTVLLLLVFIGLVGANLLLPELEPFTIAGITLPLAGGAPSSDVPVIVEGATERTALIASIRNAYIPIRDNRTNVYTQFQQVLQGGQLDCAAFFNTTVPVTLSEADRLSYPDLASAVDLLNQAETQVKAAYVRYEQGCFENNPITIPEIGGLLAPLVAAEATLNQVDAALTATAATAIPVVIPTATTETLPSAEPPTLEPAATAPPTVQVQIANTREQLRALYSIVDGMTTPRGPLGLLEQYWSDVETAGVTDGCQNSTITIPEAYVLPEADAASTPQLVQAVQQINAGLDLLRDGWAHFQTACTSGELVAQIGRGKLYTSTGRDAFTNANNLLNVVRDAS